MIRHAGLIARHGPRGWSGALIEGPSGAGKSDLALRAQDLGFRLVADDRVLVWSSDGGLFGRAPEPLAGLMEVRGLGVLPFGGLRFCRISLIVRAGEPERLPEPAFETLLGVELPSLLLDLTQASAPAKLNRAMSAFDAAHKRRI